MPARLVGWLLLALLAAWPARAGEPPLVWSFTGCTWFADGVLHVEGCKPVCLTLGSNYLGGHAQAIVTATGTLHVQLAWELGGPETMAWTEFLTFYQNDLPVLVFESPSAWCPTPACTGTLGLDLPVQAGDVLSLSLTNFWSLCEGPTSCSFALDFTPPSGFVPGFGGVDERLIATAQGGDDDRLGGTIVFLDDLDADGASDLAIAAIDEYVRLVSGASGATLFTIPKPLDFIPEFGGALAAVGDVDGDGVGDLLIGQTGQFSPNEAVRLHSGADGHLLHLLDDPVSKESFGYAVSGVGDLNADGVPDLLIGAPDADGQGAGSGLARIHSGATFLPLLQMQGQAGDAAGHGVAAVGDVNGDGKPDFAVASTGADVGATSAGVVRIHSGQGAQVLHELPGPALQGAQFGFELAAAGDIDHDGCVDVVASAPFTSTAGSGSGQVRAFSGKTGALLLTLDGAPDEHLGTCVSAAGDWDGDGHDDVLAGTWLGVYVAVYSGATQQLLLKLQHDLPWTYFGYSPSTFGESCGGAGDADADGRPDFAVGATHWDPDQDIGSPGDVGKVFVYSGRSDDYVPPSLAGTGSLLPGTPFRLELEGGDPLAQALLVAGLQGTATPFKTGAIVPTPDVLLALALDASGALTLSGDWPLGVPAGTTLWAQAWLPDDDGFAGWLASPSLAITTP